MRGKIVSIFLIISIGIFSLISSVNAQDTDSIKLYEYSEGIELAKSTGKPIAISFLGSDYDFPKTKGEMNKVININCGSTKSIDSLVCIMMYRKADSIEVSKESTKILILDSDGREIVRIVQNPIKGRADINLTRFDADRKVIGNLFLIYPPKMDELDTFYSETFKYAETKKGKVQRLLQDKGLVYIKDFKLEKQKNPTNSIYYGNYVVISGIIRDIQSGGGSYGFSIDDGTGVINFFNGYEGSLADIKEGDKVFVKFMDVGYESTYLIFTVSKSQIESSAKTPGFEIIIGVAAVLFARRKMIGK
jgi:hypothetical protein